MKIPWLIGNQKGGTLAYTLVAVVVVTLLIAGMLEMTLMSYRAGAFQERRQRALAAAESGIAVAIGKLANGDEIPRASYSPKSPASPSIDSAAGNWIGKNTGGMPSELELGPSTAFKVWVSETVGDRTTVVSRGSAGGSSRTVGVTLTKASGGPQFLVAATQLVPSSKEDINMNKMRSPGKFEGNMRIEGTEPSAISVPGKGTGVVCEGRLLVRPTPRINGITNKVKHFFSSVDIDRNEYQYPAPVAPSGLPDKGELYGTKTQPVHITESASYLCATIKGRCEVTIDATRSDIVLHFRKGVMITAADGEVPIIKIKGDHTVKFFIDGAPNRWNCETEHRDPTKLIIHSNATYNKCDKKDETRVILKPYPFIAAVVYAPRVNVDGIGYGTFSGAIVGNTVKFEETGRYIYPVEYAENIRNLNLGIMNPVSIPQIGSWTEINP